MNKIKNFFFNKIVKDKPTSFSALVTSFILGGVKIFILLMLNGIIINLIMPNSPDDKYFLFFQIISITIFLLILIYIFVNRIPNQIKVFSNYLYTIKLNSKNIKTSNNINQNTILTMGKIKISKIEIRATIVLMIINAFALFVNYFGLSPKFENENGYKTIRLFTSATNGTLYPYNSNYDVSHADNFYPFVKFYGNSQSFGFYFNGIFPYYDMSEFVVYTVLIFGVLFIKKLW